MTADLPRGWAWSTLDQLGEEVRGSIRPINGRPYELYSVPTYPTGKPDLVPGEAVAVLEHVGQGPPLAIAASYVKLTI